tara:strand:- start:1107 stop:2369 length:1263 start_codon:yes stop_codon:yes gene_type:complete
MKKIFITLCFLAGVASALLLIFNPEKQHPLQKEQQRLIDSEITASNTLKIVKEGEVLYENIQNSGKLGDKDINEKTIFPIWSMSKPITTVAMMVLHDQGGFNLEDNLSKYLPEFENMMCKNGDTVEPCKNKIKIIDLLTHRAGFGYYTDVYGENSFAGPPSPLNKYMNTYVYKDLNEFSLAVSKQVLEFEPGKHYFYGLNQDILGRVIEVITGKTFYEYLVENLFIPLEMNETKFHLTIEDRERFQPLFINRIANSPMNPSDNSLKGFTNQLDQLSYSVNNKAFMGSGGLVSTMADYSNFCQMLVGRGNFKGKQILSQKSFDLMLQKHTEPYPNENEPYLFPDMPGHYFAFNFSVLEDESVDLTGAPAGVYGWSGYHNTHFWIDPENKLYGLFMSRSREFDFGIPMGIKTVFYKTINNSK